MPSIKDAIDRNSRRIAAGGETQTSKGNEISDLAAISSPPQDLPLGGGLPQRGMFPANLVLASDRSDSSRVFRGMGTRSATFPYQTIPQNIKNTTIVQASAATVSAAVVALSLETDGISNPNQKILNLISGAGISLASDPTGGVTIDTTSGSGGDGLIHGETPWETDPAMVVLVDDFFAGTNTSPYGVLGWQQNGQMSNVHEWTGSAASANIGALSWDNGTNSGIAGQLLPGWANNNDAFTGAWSGLFDSPSWKMIWVFQFQRAPTLSSTAIFSTAQKSLYVGMGFSNTAISYRPPVFIGVRYDTDTTAPSINDTTFNFEVVVNAIAGSRNNTQGTVFDTGMIPAEGKWYRLEISSNTVGTVDMSLTDGTTTFTKKGITVPQATTGSASLTVQGQTGQLLFGTGGVVLPFSPGTNLIVSGIIGTGSTFNGTWPVTDISSSSISALGGITLGNTGVTAIFSALPSMYPMVIFGNDTGATPVATMKILIDYFSFVWNPGTNGGTGTPTSTLARYW